MEDRVRLVTVGDIYMEHGIGKSRVVDYISEADCVFGNLEGAVADSDVGVPADKTVLLRSASKWANQLRNLGIKAVSLANNHMMDYGHEALAQTIQTLDKLGIKHAGAGINSEMAFRPAYITVKGVKIALLSFSCTLPPNYRANESRPGVAGIRITVSIEPDFSRLEEEPGSTSLYVHTKVFSPDLEKAKEMVAQASQEADIVVVAMHWGVSRGWAPVVQGQLADYQIPLGEALIEAGADIVSGGHAHVIHGIRVFKNAVIAYCHGNFIWHYHNYTPARLIPPYKEKSGSSAEDKKEGYLFEVSIERGASTPIVKRLSVIPYLLDEQGDPQLVTPTLGNELLVRIADYRESGDLAKKWKVADGVASIPVGRPLLRKDHM